MKYDPDVFWMIRHKESGLYSKGGACNISFNYMFKKIGKHWNSRGALMCHLKMMNKLISKWRNYDNKIPHPYEKCEVVQFRKVEEASVDCVGYGE